MLSHAWIPAVLITALRIFWSWGMLYCNFCLNTCRSEHGTHSILYCLPNLDALSWERPSDPHAALQTFNKQLDAEDSLSIAWKTYCPTVVTLYKTYMSADCWDQVHDRLPLFYTFGNDKTKGKICIGSKRSMEKEWLTIANILSDNLSALEGSCSRTWDVSSTFWVYSLLLACKWRRNLPTVPSEIALEYFFFAVEARQKRVLSCLFSRAGLTSISEELSMSQNDLWVPWGVSGSVKPTAAHPLHIMTQSLEDAHDTLDVLRPDGVICVVNAIWTDAD